MYMEEMTLNSPDQLWAEYRQQLYYFILKRVNDADIAEDIVQDVFAKVFAKRDSLRDDSKIRPWLYQITRNAITDYYRSRKDAVELPEELPALDLDDESVSKELAECCIRPFIEQLPSQYKEAVMLSEIEGLTQAEVAERQEISLSGAKSRVQRGAQNVESKFDAMLSARIWPAWRAYLVRATGKVWRLLIDKSIE